MEYVKQWLPIESNPDVLNTYLSKLGLEINKTQLFEVLSTEEWALDMVPKPVIALIFLFPLKEREDRRVLVRNDNIKFLKQTIDNSCATMALLHAMVNCRDNLTFTPGSFLEKFVSDINNISSEDITRYIESSSDIETLHSQAAEGGEGHQIDPDDVNTHFVCICLNGEQLIELDGRKEGPILLGASSSESFLEDAIKAIAEEYMAPDPEETRFSILALASSEQ